MTTRTALVLRKSANKRRVPTSNPRFRRRRATARAVRPSYGTIAFIAYVTIAAVAIGIMVCPGGTGFVSSLARPLHWLFGSPLYASLLFFEVGLALFAFVG